MRILERILEVFYQRSGFEIVPDGDVYLAQTDQFEWFIPYDDEGQANWCRSFFDSHERYLDYLSRGDTIIEVGAATGEYTVKAADKIGPSGNFYTFEAEPKNLECLQKNLAAHNLRESVIIEKQAVSDKAGEDLTFAVADSIADHRFDPEMDGEMNPREADEYDSITVPTTTIDAYCKSNGIHSIDLLKLTANGHEGEILDGAREMLPETKYVFSNYPYDDVEEILFKYGFEVEANRNHNSLGKPHLYVRTSARSR